MVETRGIEPRFRDCQPRALPLSYVPNGVPGRSRTFNPQVRSLVLCPVELRAHGARKECRSPPFASTGRRAQPVHHASNLDRATRIELASSAWKADALPLSYARWGGQRGSNPHLQVHSLVCRSRYTMATMLNLWWGYEESNPLAKWHALYRRGLIPLSSIPMQGLTGYPASPWSNTFQAYELFKDRRA